MAQINIKRVLLGALAGGAAWSAWSLALNMLILAPRYDIAEKAGLLLAEPNGFSSTVFIALWIVLLFVLSFIVVGFYAASRPTRGAGPGPAVLAGAMFGFAAGVPISFSVASWGTFGRGIPFFWTVDMFIGAILAAVIGGWLYKD